jgi:hypothetical protein
MDTTSSSLPPTAVRMEQRFFSIVRGFGLIVTAAALIGACVLGIMALKQATSSADETVRKPTASYADYQRVLDKNAQANTASGAGGDTTLQRKEAEAARANAELELEHRLQPHLDVIMASLNSYATAVDVPKPDAQHVKDFIRQMQTQITTATNNDALGWGYVEGLEKSTKELAADAGRIAKMDAGDARRVRWDQFLQWYYNAYVNQINLEERRIQGERSNAELQKAGALVQLYLAAGAFGVFVMATILLVLLRIERNTRQET